VKSLIGGLLDKSPVPLAATGNRRSLGTVRGQNDRTAQLEAMGAVGTLFSIVSRTSNATSQVNWHLWRKAPSGLKEDRQEVTRHAALDLWAKPNPFYTRQEFVETFQQHVDLTGECEWLVSRAAGIDIPLELWPVRPDRIKPVPHPTEFLSGWLYVSPDGQRIPLELNEVIQLRTPNPSDPYRGLGPVQPLLTTLDSATAADEWNRNFFRNSAEPGGIIQVDKRLSDDEFDEMTSRWNEQHRGVARAHRVAVIEQGQWVDRSYSQRDMQFVQLRQVTRDQIMEAYAVSKPMLGISEDVNRAAADAGLVQFARYLTVPRLERIKGALNNDLLPMFGRTADGLEFDYENPVPDDEAAEMAEFTSKVDAVVALVGAGFEPSAVLATVGLPDMPMIPKGVPANAQPEPV
jgi:HK97 family phage portal protein